MVRRPSSSISGFSSTPSRRLASSISRRIGVPAKGEEYLVLGERRERQRFGERRERVVLRDDHDQVLAEDVDAAELRRVDRPRQDGEVELALDQLRLDDRVRALDDVQGDVGIVLLQRFEEQGHDPPTGRADHAEDDLAVDLGVEF